MRLDQYLAAQSEIKSRSSAQKLIEAGLVRVGGKVIRKPSFDIASHEVTWTLPAEAAVPEGTTSAITLEVLHEDDDCMVICKPAGLTVHPGSGTKKDEETLLDALRPMFAKRKLPFSASEVLVHRLDKETTGCLLVAKNGKAHLMLQKQFAERTVDKRYLTLVAGHPKPPAAVIDAPIGRHASERTRMSVYQAVEGRAARTTYRTLGVQDSVALLECELHTGRTHQIRVHLRSIGHPVLGDTTYGNATSLAIAEEHGADLLCLHAWKLSFVSPSKKKVKVVCAVPEKFANLLKKIGFVVPKK